MLTKEDKTLIKKCLGIKKVQGETIYLGIFKQEMEQAWC